jgi:hypothetical protein
MPLKNLVARIRSSRLADDLLRLAVRVDVGGVDEGDPGVDGAVDHADGLLVVGLAPGAEHHGAEAEARDLHAGASEVGGGLLRGLLCHERHATR